MGTPLAMTQPRVLNDEHGLILTRVAWVAAICHPLYTPPWEIPVIRANDVLDAAQAGRFTHHPHAGEWTHDPDLRPNCWDCHVGRIAWFAANPRTLTDTDPHPIEVDVGFGGFTPQWPVLDGNHRLAAAIATQQPLIAVAAAGDWDRAINVLVHGHDIWEAA